MTNCQNCKRNEDREIRLEKSGKIFGAICGLLALILFSGGFAVALYQQGIQDGKLLTSLEIKK